jgi:hypothetical protein
MSAITLFPDWTITRAAGFVAYSTASLGCAAVWLWARAALRRSAGLARLALVLSVVELFFALDMIFEWRLALHASLAGLFTANDLYDRRYPFQLWSLVALALILLTFLAYLFRRYRGRPGARIALTGTSLSSSLWLTEIISMHSVDQTLYHMVNNIMMVAVLWILLCALTLLGVGIEAQRAARKA